MQVIIHWKNPKRLILHQICRHNKLKDYASINLFLVSSRAIFLTALVDIIIAIKDLKMQYSFVN